MESLSLNQIESDEIDLLSSIIAQKNINHNFLKNEKIIKNVNHTTINPEEIIGNTINKDNIQKVQKEEIKEEIKEKNEIIFSEGEMENKTVDEIYNYINGNNDIKIKKKKKNKRKKNKKNDKQIKIDIEEKKVDDYDDEIINNFKQKKIKNMIDANKINKIKPFVSENFLKIISHKY